MRKFLLAMNHLGYCEIRFIAEMNHSRVTLNDFALCYASYFLFSVDEMRIPVWVCFLNSSKIRADYLQNFRKYLLVIEWGLY